MMDTCVEQEVIELLIRYAKQETIYVAYLDGVPIAPNRRLVYNDVGMPKRNLLLDFTRYQTLSKDKQHYIPVFDDKKEASNYIKELVKTGRLVIKKIEI